MATKSSTFSSVISGSPMITSEKLVGSENYLSWSASVVLWFMGQGYKDHLVTQEANIPEAKGLYTNDIQRLYKEEFLTVMPLTTDVGDQRIQIDKFFMVLTLIGLRPDLETVRDQILGNSSVPSLDDVFARLLRISSTQTLPFDNTSDSSMLVFQTNSRGGRNGNRGRGQCPHCTYCNKLGHTHDRCYQLHGRPPRTAHATKSAFVAQTGNAFACLTHTSSLGPWILDSGASDHIYGNKDLFSSITTTSALPIVTLVNGSQTMAKGFGFAHPLPSLSLHSVLYAPECHFNLISINKITRTLNCSITFSDKFVTLQDWSTGKTIGIGRESQGLYHLTSPSPAVCISTDAPLFIHSRLGHLSLSKFQKMVPSFSSLSSLACESCQLGKHTRVSFPKRLNYWAKSHFELVHTDVWGFCRTATNFLLEPQNASSWDIPDFKRVIVVIPLRLIATFSPLMSPLLVQTFLFLTLGQGVLYENIGHTQVVGYTDADWAGSPTDRRSTSGYCVFIGGNLISWKSKKQDVVANSSAEAKYRVMALATCELIWLKHLLRELRFGKDEQMKLICDNQVALHITSNTVFHERIKHIEVDCHFIREKIASGCVATSFVNSNDQLADIFTKSLRGPRIKYICNKFGAYNIYALA
ncbi:Retrovirus-related Pol polyprotein from transposon RE1 [Vitis vinifera]|uniref:Retrovirus-related Pol polyprotein from transposon RE1 n=1 Tax=Vitis vinifera TaxID=29760 RepID=A0A438D6Z9_VITVI|nr:Retrovirus-related Pol polyprotein from transposon RE1 [Vitis vinifera]